jgi:hypothetical protein
MHHTPCLEADDEKSKEGSKEEIGHLQPSGVTNAIIPGMNFPPPRKSKLLPLT